MNKVYIGLGSNLGCKVGNIRRAIRLLASDGRIQNVELSSFYKTDPVGGVEQDWFVNAVARFDTELSARELLSLCLEVERELKRVRGERWGPRTLDIDILFFGDERIEEEDLAVPHPRIRERAFVLVPLLELDAGLAMDGVALSESLSQVKGQAVEKLKPVVAVVGASPKPDRYANMAQRQLMEAGHEVALVAPREESILGVPVVRTLTDCPNPVDTVTLYIGSARVDGILEDLLSVRPQRVIFNPGTENQGVRSRLEQEGIETLEACTLVMLRTGQW
ncbi:2-amino-4-hydroxy-6-hydroxymethyldihydropteridine diphosphokinase [Pelagicoccus sp. SDUM812005]|uniref:2-amino-4-hydroxy-6- hydroxymethyldihydropteridine diphosphokinase n=1 Tax=Pelagicoccus sp. SDUM812005 TaxID=3041257 RepID=UPI00280E85E8|nr:2-amino-4-hydroxy-6-hydroxymethyldihydropteridine diphosphokinase [Pelagicoccus sp. SDUM812005]MDQ8180969.1 2-amino-4-hydroxy-6-hydroxymethyldihydropteridine diphosphokinase [Pelagicoccus sp. SDUM812005]